MLKLEVIGNLGANAQVKGENGRLFISFNVAHTDRWTDDQGVNHDTTQWVSCIINDPSYKILPYLVKGKSVYVRGNAKLRVFSSEKERRMVAGVTINVQDIELIGGQVDAVPKNLNDAAGVIYPIYKAFYIDPNIAQKPTELLDTQMNKYSVNENGFVTKLPPSTGQSEDNNAENPHQGDNAKPF